jgi:tetratricopeptide (TPR) repeat protein
LLGWKSYAQTSTWRDTETLWRHALAVDEANEVAHNNLAFLLIGRGEIDEAVAHYQAALRSVPEIENHTQLSPAIIHNSLGNALVRKGDIAGAIAHYRSAVALRPEYADAHVNLAAMLRRQGNLDAAIAEYRQVVTGPGEDAGTHEQLAAMLTEANRLSEAAVEYRRALEIAPDSLNSLNALAWILASSADQNQVSAGQALLLAERANRLTAGRDPIVLRILAACYAGTGRPTEAASTAERALSLAGSNHALVSALQTEVARYKSATGL